MNRIIKIKKSVVKSNAKATSYEDNATYISINATNTSKVKKVEKNFINTRLLARNNVTKSTKTIT